MTDPERIAKRSTGLAAQLLLAGAEEQPTEASVQQTLAALGVSAAIVTTTGAASAVAGGAKAGSVLASGSAGGAGLGAAATGSAVKALSATLLVKWIGIGVVGGVSLAGAAAVVTAPADTSAGSRAPTFKPALSSPKSPAPAPLQAEVVAAAPLPSDAETPSAAWAPLAIASTTPAFVGATEPLPSAAPLEVGAPLAAEVAYVDRARALLVAGQAEPGLALLRGYERAFPEARLLPEVLFLQLETCDRLGRQSEARGAAQRLLEGFPKSPHASRARKLLFP